MCSFNSHTDDGHFKLLLKHMFNRANVTLSSLEIRTCRNDSTTTIFQFYHIRVHLKVHFNANMDETSVNGSINNNRATRDAETWKLFSFVRKFENFLKYWQNIFFKVFLKLLKVFFYLKLQICHNSSSFFKLVTEAPLSLFRGALWDNRVLEHQSQNWAILHAGLLN